MIFGGRGGYCLEQNMLFRAGLRSLGYQITSLQGRVVRGMAIDAPRPAILVLLQVELPEGPYLADVGFGNLAPTSHSCCGQALSRTRHTSRCDLLMSVAS
jgi:N-hydroxyarylamine O-acetyltransferase